MADASVDIKITSDAKGAADAERSLGRVSRAADDAGRSVSNSMGRASAVVGRLRAGLSQLLNVGIAVTAVQALVSLYERLSGRANAAAKAAREVAKANAEAADSSKAAKLAEEYERIAKAADRAAKAQSRANELADMERDSARELEDIEAAAARDADLAALDPGDPLYERRRAQVEARHAAASANRAASRRVQDAQTAAGRSMQESEDAASLAASLSLSLASDRDGLAALGRRRAAAAEESVSDNSLDAQGFAGMFFSNLKSIITGDFSRVGDHRTAEGDQVRSAAAERERDLAAKEAESRRTIARKEAEIAELEERAAHLAKRSAVQSGLALNAQNAASLVASQGARSVASADAALDADAAANADARLAMAQLAAQRSRVESQIAAQRGRKDEASLAVFNAQGAADLARANGDRRGYSDATANLTAARGAADEVNHSADSMINSLMQTLNAINSRIRAAEDQIRRSSSQSQYAWREVPGE